MKLFGNSDKPDVQSAYSLYCKGKAFNYQIDLENNVRVNEDMFVGKQWEGVQANGLPTPVFNILKRDVCFTVANITSDNLKVQGTPLAATPRTNDLIEPARIFTEECEAVMERNNIVSLLREFARDAAVRGDGCLYTYWDADAETGMEAKGMIRTETVENTRVFFGNPNDRHVQSQPYIQIASRECVRSVQDRARENGFENWQAIAPDLETDIQSWALWTDDKVTVLLTMWYNPETKSIWAYESTQMCGVREPWDMGIRRYPIVWLNWDYIQNSYHGMAMITGLIPNQIFINKVWAMSMLSVMSTAYPKVLFDKTRISKWTNRVGEAIGVNGGDMNTVAKLMSPAMVSPQISEFIQLAVEQTNQSLGATAVALGDTRPDNTSAIIALQRAASTPSEITKQNLHKCVEELALIYLEFMAEYYGKREVDMETPEQLDKVFEFVGEDVPAEIPVEFDFGELKDIPMQMKLDVGASSYYSEIASIQTMDNLLQLGKITVEQYLARIPDGYIPDRRGLLAEIKRATQQAMQAQAAQSAEGDVAEQGIEEEIPTGGGYSALQRKINEGA